MINKNKNKLKAKLLASFLMFLVLVGNFCLVSAENTSELNVKFENPIDADSVYELVTTILDFMVKIGAILAIFLLIYSGYLFVSARGNEEQIKKAKNAFFWTVVGGLIVIGAKTLSEVICNTAEEFGVSCD